MSRDEWLAAHEEPLSAGDLTLDPAELRAALGYGSAAPGPEVQRIVDRLAAQARAVCRPRLGFRVVEGRVDAERLTLCGNTFAPGAIIAAQLRKGCSFAVLLASVGAELDAWLHELREGPDVVSAYVADALGSVLAEAIVACGLERLEHHAAARGWRITNSYSPGYCGWDVSEQHGLFALLPDGFCGVRLCESGLMLPIKSVSAVVGLGPEVVRRDYGCALCRKADCYKRRLRQP